MNNKPTVAILGASADRAKFGNKSLRAHLACGYDVFPINPKGGTMEGLQVYARISDVPLPRLNRISVYLPADLLLPILDEVAATGCDELWLNPGSDDNEVIARLKKLGLDPIIGCSIVDLGVSPAQFP